MKPPSHGIGAWGGNSINLKETAMNTSAKLTLTYFATGAVAFAQEAVQAAGSVATTANAAATDAASQITPLMILEKGGGLMYVIAALSLLAIALTFFFALTLRANLLYPRSFLLEAQDAAEAGDLPALKEACRESNCIAARILNSALEQCSDDQVVDYELLKDGVEDEGGRQASLLWQRLQYLMDIAVIAPMVGLLGTIWGMMLSFQNFENSDISAKVQQLTGGVSTAMYTTFGGLVIGIFAMAMYDILRGHLNKLVGGLESACTSVLRRLPQRIRK